MNQANRHYWDALASRWQTLRDQDQLWRECAKQPQLAFEGEALAIVVDPTNWTLCKGRSKIGNRSVRWENRIEPIQPNSKPGLLWS